MTLRRAHWYVLIALGSMGASYRTANFVVEAPNPQIAQQVGHQAEHYRKEKALQWLGKEMPTWGQPCPLQVTVTPGGAGGFTTFEFDGQGGIRSIEMSVQGSLDRILQSVLPHEVTHTVFAYHFRRPLPRWADEGGSVLSEDGPERRRHDELVRHTLAGGKAFRLRVLFDMKKYPPGEDVMTLYAQGYSLCRFLVESGSRPQFLAFIGEGMRNGWDQAVQTHFGMNRLEDLEQAWLTWMRQGNRAEGLLVNNRRPAADSAGERPLANLRPPIVRAAGEDDAPRPFPPSRPPSPVNDGWAPVHPIPSASAPARAQLLPPLPEPPP